MTAVSLLCALAGACGGTTDLTVAGEAPGDPPVGSTATSVLDSTDNPTSIVQLGDSIASGEGTLYGYTYDQSTRTWTGGNIDAPWPPPYPECHDSPDAYGNVVASYFNATFTQFACSGATFANGITSAQMSDGSQMRPAQFGDWANQSEINAAYDAADPDLVLVTLGADDLQFSIIVEDCIENGYWYYFGTEDLQCVAGNPGATIDSDFFDFLPTLRANYATLASWINERAVANGRPAPKVVFTNYANPLPADGAKCPDTSWLYPEQTTYLSSLVTEVNEVIESTIEGLGLPNVTLADISAAYTPQGVSHIWCSDDPWAYGLSIYSLTSPFSFYSLAPFHPTPAGQDSIAAHVIPAVRQLFPDADAFAGRPTR